MADVALRGAEGGGIPRGAEADRDQGTRLGRVAERRARAVRLDISPRPRA